MSDIEKTLVEIKDSVLKAMFRNLLFKERLSNDMLLIDYPDIGDMVLGYVTYDDSRAIFRPKFKFFVSKNTVPNQPFFTAVSSDTGIRPQLFLVVYSNFERFEMLVDAGLQQIYHETSLSRKVKYIVKK